MPWPIFFKTIGIIYGLYYTLLICYELICYYKKESKKPNTGFQELDTSHLNIRPRQDFTPKLVNIIPQDVVIVEEVANEPQLPTYSEPNDLTDTTNVDIEDVDNSLNVIVEPKELTMEDFLRETTEFEDSVKHIVKKDLNQFPS
jgi:hypothetical protein